MVFRRRHHRPRPRSRLPVRLARGAARLSGLARAAGRGAPASLAAGGAALGAAAILAWRRRRGEPLTGEVALVTGGSRGLGYLLARRLLREGCTVVICGRDGVTLERAVERLRFEEGATIAMLESPGATAGETADMVGPGAVLAARRCDVGDEEAVRELVEAIVARFGRLDIVVNNAGIIQVGPVEAMALEDFHSTMDADYWGAVHTTLAVLPGMRSCGHGRLVNITSIASDVAVPRLLPYVAAKHAKLGFSDALRAELAAEGVTVTTVIPGLMRTGSPVHADFRGRPEREYAWFVLGDILPFTAMSAERAAARIVRAIRRKEARVTLSWQARTLRLLHGLAPCATGRGLRAANRLLSAAVDGDRARPDAAPGTALRGTLPAPVEWALDHAAWRANQ
jgi:NAD(P)-dependent dehydrogenase (short-subunit alcohol dehydrogenase family)